MLLVVAALLLALQATRADNLGTLKTFQRAACDEEAMTLKCPPGTAISVTLAHYGNANPSIFRKCITSGTNALDKQGNDTCRLTDALQYALLQAVVEVCQKKRQCKFNTNPRTFKVDPCPGLSKYAEVAYQCRPYEFRSKVACENDNINLVCNPLYRVAIYSAAYGRTKFESVQCPQPRGVEEETCLASHATETMMQKCHGQRKCTVVANGTTFQNTCGPHSKAYLKVVYTCVPWTVLRDQSEGGIEADERNMVHEFEEGFDRADFRTEFSPSPNLEGPQPQPRDNASRNGPTVSSSPPRARTNNDENQEKFYLYVIVSVAAGILLFLGIIIGRLLVSRHRAKRNAKFHANNETLPNGFTDDISEIDADIDLTTPIPVSMNDARTPETQLAERLHGERYYVDSRMPLSTAPVHGTLHPISSGMRVDLGNHMVGTDSLHTILRAENPRSLTNKSYYYG
ncbi:protein eva-1 isoform X3 [Orussus abietinus]|uniref:protein eva-1 isoform X3 n=1 Tax=Orussus abietinus TaxID=222816 RepID=UPI000C715EDB|nr:protein eva-1 isoform X3 [Orussus abietinus]